LLQATQYMRWPSNRATVESRDLTTDCCTLWLVPSDGAITQAGHAVEVDVA